MATILIVDDDPDIRTIVAELLAEAGHVVREAIDVLAALQQTRVTFALA